jgi:WD40 repeat protein
MSGISPVFPIQGHSSLLFRTFPEDIFIEIFFRLNLGDLGRLSLVSRDIYQLLKSEASVLLWKDLHGKLFPETHKRYSKNLEKVDYRERFRYNFLIDKNMRAGCTTNQTVTLEHPDAHFAFSSIIESSILPNHCFFTCSNAGVICIWNRQGKLLNTFGTDVPPPGRWGLSQFVVHVEENQIHIRSKGRVNTLQTYDLEGHRVRGPVIMFDPALCIKICGSYAVKGSQDACVEILDCETGKILKEIQGPIRPRSTLRRVDMNSRYIVAGIQDKSSKKCTVQIWDRSGLFLQELPIDSVVQSMYIQGDRLFITACDHGDPVLLPSFLEVWSLATFEKLGQKIDDIYDFSVDDDHLVTQSKGALDITLAAQFLANSQIQIWDLRDIGRQPIHTLTRIHPFPNPLDRVVYMRDGSLYLIHDHGKIEIFDFSDVPPQKQDSSSVLRIKE